jgi:hypothetical protein
MTREQATEMANEVLTVCKSYLPPPDHPDRAGGLLTMGAVLTGIGMSLGECVAPGEGRWRAVKQAAEMKAPR